MLEKIKQTISEIDNLSKTKPIKIISHFDTDGITSAAIFSRCFQRWHKKFSLKIVKNLDEQLVKSLPDNEILIFLDLASSSFPYLKKKNTEIFIFDHHEIPDKNIPQNIRIINPLLYNYEQISSSAICYLFAKSLSTENRDLATLALIGLVGDMLEKTISKTFDEIIKDADAIIKKGLLLYPSTRPIDKALEYSSSLYIPGITGNRESILSILREANIPKIDNNYKSLSELTEQEMSNLITAIILKSHSHKDISDFIGNLYLIKIFNKLEDAREFSALINACSRMDNPEIALGFCLGNSNCIKEAEKKYIEYKQQLASALKFIEESEKITGSNYTIINAKNNIKDTIIGTVASIISNSPLYPSGSIIIALAYNEDKIKASARIVGKEGKNVREILSKAIVKIGGEVGGHPNAAGCLIPKDKESQFLQQLQKILDIEVVKV
ncbi:MAG: DHH family phosphoesterase [Candidatus Pacearchaeota archaeon]|nr:DHH family phosphoesterase [Candidatus Pacearchaeota archaeon]